jgi:hypothetical protein
VPKVEKFRFVGSVASVVQKVRPLSEILQTTLRTMFSDLGVCGDLPLPTDKQMKVEIMSFRRLWLGQASLAE